MHRRCLRDFHCFVLINLRPLRDSVCRFYCQPPPWLHAPLLPITALYLIILRPSVTPCALLFKSLSLSLHTSEEPFVLLLDRLYKTHVIVQTKTRKAF